MWATVGAALKKIAVALLGNPKVLKTIGGIVLGLIIIIVMPVVAIVSIFNGDIEIDTNELQRMVVENLSAEEQAKLQFVEDTMYAIEREMKASGFSDPRVTEAQVLFTLSLYDYAQEADFVSKLVGCFASEQTDEQLIAAVNAAFGTAISAEEFSQVMGAIRSVYIDTSGYIDPCTKNNLDLVEWAKQAKLRGWGYEELFHVQRDERITHYFGDYGSHFFNMGVTDQEIQPVYEKALAVMEMDDAGFRSTKEFLHRGEIIGRMRDCLLAKELHPGEEVLFVGTEPYGGPGDFELRGGHIRFVDPERKTCTVRGSFFDMKDVPLRYVLGRYNAEITETHYGRPHVEVLFGEYPALAQQYLHEAEERWEQYETDAAAAPTQTM